ncbi:hypothetical protein LINPERHAP2_LOCUS28879 [Linum perenne]
MLPFSPTIVPPLIPSSSTLGRPPDLGGSSIGMPFLCPWHPRFFFSTFSSWKPSAGLVQNCPLRGVPLSR